MTKADIKDTSVPIARDWSLSAWCILAAFGTYFCMYAFRKPFTAAGYQDVVFLGMGFKTVLVTAQVLGYTVSKFLGIKFVAEVSRTACGIALRLIAVAEVALPCSTDAAPWNQSVVRQRRGCSARFDWCRLPEGRRHTEALAGCAVVSAADGVVKSVGDVVAGRRVRILDAVRHRFAVCAAHVHVDASSCSYRTRTSRHGANVRR